MTHPARNAANRIPVPVAESQLSLNTASSGAVGLAAVGKGTMGGVRTTTMCSPGTAKAGDEILLSCFFTAGTPQTKTSTLSKIHGSHAARSFAEEIGAGVCIASPVAGGAQDPLSFGFQNFNSTTVATIEHSEATISTSHGP